MCGRAEGFVLRGTYPIPTFLSPSAGNRAAHNIQYAEELYGHELEKMRKDAPKDDAEDEGIDGEEVKAEMGAKLEPEFDIAAEIEAEVKGLRKPTSEPLFTNVKVDVQCGESTPAAFGHSAAHVPVCPVNNPSLTTILRPPSLMPPTIASWVQSPKCHH